MDNLIELDSLEILVIVDNELDPISPCPNPAITQLGGLRDITTPIPESDERHGSSSGCHGIATPGPARALPMENICCSAHGLSLMLTGTKDGKSHTLLFDTGPEESAFERNALRLKADLGRVERIHLSHWHRDHSGGMLRALEMINESKASHAGDSQSKEVIVDLHPDRPDFRGVMAVMPVSMAADPHFAEIEKVGAKVEKHAEDHLVLDDFFGISGEIPRVTKYEHGLKRGIRFESKTGKWREDTEIKDERFVMCKLKGKGLVMFTGCSHAGVVNATKQAAKLGGDVPVYCVMGGYHLADADEELLGSTIQDLQAVKPSILLAGHCTGWRAKFEIEKTMPGVLVPSFVGSKFML